MVFRRANDEGTAYFLRSTGKWMVAYTELNGKRKTLRSPTQTEKGAQAYLRKLLSLRDGGMSSDRAPTLADFFPAWLETKRVAGCRPRTLEAYTERMQVHVLPDLGAVRLDKLTPERIDALYGRLLDRGLSRTTVSGIHALLHNFLRTAKRRRLAPSVPTEYVEPPRPTVHDARTLTVDEAQYLLASITDHPYGPLWTFMLGTGCRFGEAAGLTWAHVDLDAGVVRIRQQVTREKDRQTGKYVLMFTPVKTDAGKRDVPLADWVVAALRKQRAHVAELKLQAAKGTWADHDLVFTNRTGGPLRENHVLVIWHRALVSMGLEGELGQAPLRMHDLRHTKGTLMADAGEDIVAIQRTLGHSRSGITADIYVGKVPNALRAASDRYAELLKPKDQKERASSE